MREILFRGKRVDGKGWVEGSLDLMYDGTPFIAFWVSELLEHENNYSEMVCKNHEVHPETLGQFTGLLDKNGKRIFEGDVLSLGSADFGFVSNGKDEPAKYMVKSSKCDYVLFRHDISLEWGRLSRVNELSWHCEIIGNIHDSPNLLK